MSSRLSRILVAVDGSDHADRAYEHAMKLATLAKSKVFVITVIHATHLTGVDKKVIQQIIKQMEVSAKILLNKYSMDAYSKHRVEIETILAHGYPQDVIIDTAKQKDANLIILGSRGLSGMKEMFLGSVSLAVVRKASIPVLVTK